MSDYSGRMFEKRKSVPQAGDTDVEKKRKELRLKQAEAAGVFSLDKPMPLSPQVGADVDMDKDPEEEGFGGPLKQNELGGVDLDIESDEDIPALEQDLLYLKRGAKSRRIANAKKARDEAARKRQQLKGSITGGGTTGPTQYEAGFKYINDQMRDFFDEQGVFDTIPTKGTSAVDTNTEIYRNYIPGADDMSADALREASFDAAATQYDHKYKNQQPVSESTVEFDGVEYVEEVYDDGAVFFVPTGEDGDYMRGRNKGA
jgi:hypothetical protein